MEQNDLKINVCGLTDTYSPIICGLNKHGSKEKIFNVYKRVDAAYKAYENAMAELQAAFEEDMGKILIMIGHETLTPLENIADKFGIDINWTLDRDLDKL